MKSVTMTLICLPLFISQDAQGGARQCYYFLGLISQGNKNSREVKMRKLIILSLAFYCCNVVFAAPAAPIDDLRIERQGDNYLLTWSTPVEDIYGQP